MNFLLKFLSVFVFVSFSSKIQKVPKMAFGPFTSFCKSSVQGWRPAHLLPGGEVLLGVVVLVVVVVVVNLLPCGEVLLGVEHRRHPVPRLHQLHELLQDQLLIRNFQKKTH